MTGFERVRLGDLVTWAKGCSIPRDETSADRHIPYLHYGDLYKKYDRCLNLPEVIDEIIKIDELDSVKESQMLHDGDIVFTLTSETVDDLGHCTLIINPKDTPFVSGMETTVLHIKEPRRALPAFLNYMFQNEKFHSILRQFVTGMKVYRVHPNDLMKIEIDLPSLEYQSKVVTILDSFSNSISNLTEINDNLLGILSLEFGRIKAEYPLDSDLSDVCTLNTKRGSASNLGPDNYYSTENMLPNKSGVVPATAMPSDNKAILCESGDVLISNIRPYFKKIHYCFEPSGCSADVLDFRAKDVTYAPYLFGILYSDDFFDYVVAGSKGTKMPRGDKDQIMQYQIPMPPKEVLDTYCILGQKVLSEVASNNKEIAQLVLLRNHLLPKLMSGEIDVSTLKMPTKYSFGRLLGYVLLVCILHIFLINHSVMESCINPHMA